MTRYKEICEVLQTYGILVSGSTEADLLYRLLLVQVAEASNSSPEGQLIHIIFPSSWREHSHLHSVYNCSGMDILTVPRMEYELGFTNAGA